jgi:hypothetical protein
MPKLTEDLIQRQLYEAMNVYVEAASAAWQSANPLFTRISDLAGDGTVKSLPRLRRAVAQFTKLRLLPTPTATTITIAMPL